MPLNKEELLTALRSVTAVDNAPINASQKRYPAAASKQEQADEASSMFACGGRIDAARFSLPSCLFVQGLGELPLPLSPSDTARLISLSEQAPYGKGTATVIDKSVREARQIDASLLTYHPHNSSFFLHTVQAIAAHAVERLGMDAQTICLDAKPYKLLLYEAGGHFAFHRDTEREFGMFGTLIIQLPTLSPHQGGQLVVQHAKHSVTFDFSGSKSSKKFYFTAFFTDCQHMLKLITTGNRVCLVFNLIRQSTQVCPPHHNTDALSRSVARTEAALRAWLDDSPDDKKKPQKLFIPLEHQYTKTNLCFAGLKGRDALVAEVLRRCNSNNPSELSLELHVCIVTKHSTCDDDGYDELDSDFQVTNWVAEDDSKVDYSRMETDLSSELLMDEDDIFHEDLEPDSEEYEGYMGNYGPTTQYWYHIAMLVVWPKRKTTSVLGIQGFDGGLDLVQVKMRKGETADAKVLFKDLLKFLHSNPPKEWEMRHMWVNEVSRGKRHHEIIAKLLHLCSQVGDHADMLKIIDILAIGKDTTAQGPSTMHQLKEFGIASIEVAKMLALAVQVHGWEGCSIPILERLLVRSRITEECEYYAALALEFEAIGMHGAAVSIAKKIDSLIQNVHGIISGLSASAVSAILIMLFTFSECHDELALSFVERIVKEASSNTLCIIVVKLKDAGSSDSSDGQTSKFFCFKDHPFLLDLFSKLSLTSRELKIPEKPRSSYSMPKPSETIVNLIVKAVEAFLWLENRSLLEAMVNSLVSESQKCKDQLLLKEIIGSAGFWEKASATEWGRQALKNLVEERIRKLSNEHKPVFNWCQPMARLPNHPQVEAFLRGPLERFTYYGDFSGLPHARNFTRKYFGGFMSACHGDGYSATAQEGGRGAAAYCQITKTRHVFEQMEKQWHAGRQELARLQASIQALLGNMTWDANGGQVLMVNARPEEEHPHPLELTKRLKTDGESLGSSKNPIVL